MSKMRNRLIEKFKDEEYAHSYMEAHRIGRIAGQVYQTRKARNWTQAQLADRAGMAQERVSKIEAGDFTSLTMSTLKKLARALDVNLVVEFEPFSHSIVSVCNETLQDFVLSGRAESLQDLNNSFMTIAGHFGSKPVMLTGVVTGPSTTSHSNTTVTVGAPFTLTSGVRSKESVNVSS